MEFKETWNRTLRMPLMKATAHLMDSTIYDKNSSDKRTSTQSLDLPNSFLGLPACPMNVPFLVASLALNIFY
jgi:hypothetical protein